MKFSLTLEELTCWPRSGGRFRTCSLPSLQVLRLTRVALGSGAWKLRTSAFQEREYASHLRDFNFLVDTLQK